MTMERSTRNSTRSINATEAWVGFAPIGKRTFRLSWTPLEGDVSLCEWAYFLRSDGDRTTFRALERVAPEVHISHYMVDAETGLVLHDKAGWGGDSW